MDTQSTQPMTTLAPERTFDPFAKVNVRPAPDGRIWVRAYILMERAIEGARTGIAIDGSGTMMPWFGVQRRDAPNIVSPFVQQMCVYLARRLDVKGSTTAIYWATGSDGRHIEEIGTFEPQEAITHTFTGPKQYGTRTHLLPALRYFVERFTDALWGFYIFITDGRLDDLEDVKKYTVHLAQQISSGRRHGLKLILIGVGHHIDKAQIAELDDLETGTELDLWDHKVAHTMQHLAEIFAEVVDESVIVAPQGRVLDFSGNVVVDYRDTGVPALLEFMLPPQSTAFTLEIGDRAVTQPII